MVVAMIDDDQDQAENREHDEAGTERDIAPPRFAGHLSGPTHSI